MEKSGLVILTFNNWKCVSKLMESVLDEMMFDYVVIVDNCSTDETWGKINDLFLGYTNVKLIQARENGGYAKGNNLGVDFLIKETDVSQIFIANPDIVLNKADVEKVSKELQSGEYALLAPVTINVDGSVDEECFWDEPTYCSEILNCSLVYRIFMANKRKKTIDYSVKVMNVFAVNGSFFGVRKDAFEQVGGFDEGTFLFCEENIMGTRLKRKGYKTGIITGASYVHEHSTIIDNSVRVVRKYKIQLDSHYYYVKKYICNNKILNTILRVGQILSLVEAYLLNGIRYMVKPKREEI